MKADELAQTKQNVQRCVTELQRYAGESQQQQQQLDIIVAAFEEFSTAIEELLADREELIGTNQALETERQRYQDLMEFAQQPSGANRENNRASGQLPNQDAANDEAKGRQEACAHYSRFFNYSQELQAIADFNGYIRLVNPAWQKTLGFSRQELEGKHYTDFIHPQDLEATNAIFQPEMATKLGAIACQNRWRCKDGSYKYLAWNTFVVPEEGLRYGWARDITESQLAEEQFKAAIWEKEVLLKEVHHRVKNNLQIISSLLDIQSQYIEDRQILQMFQESQNRIKSMAIIHEKLDRSGKVQIINFGEYIESLTNSLINSYAIAPDRITLKLQLDEVLLNIQTAIPCALIINELVANALKHAFPQPIKGTITIRLTATRDYYILIVSNTGMPLQIANETAATKDLPENIDLRQVKSLGLKLVNALVEQIDGYIELDQRWDTTFRIKFSEINY